MRKKLMAGAAVLALLMNAPQVSAEDEIVIFGGEFEDEPASSAPKKAEKPAPKPPAEKTKPKEKPAPIEQPITEQPTEKPAPIEQPITEQPKEKNKPIEQPIIEKPKEKPAPIEQPITEQPTEKPAPIEQPITEQPTEKPAPIEHPVIEKPEEKPAPIEQPITEQPTEKPAPIEQPIIEQPTVEPLPPEEFDRPFEQPTDISGRQSRLDEPTNTGRSILPPSSMPKNPVPQENLKTLKPRFIKLAVDETYTYYLDKTSVQWKKMPYMADEYMADVWVRMIEREPKNLDADMENYGADNFRAEVALAREKGYQYSPEDLKVLRSQAYVLEHYYLRPKTNQIQFLCELEVFGRPQNAINERTYDYKNWEYLVPGSVESVIYDATIKIIGKSKATGRGHMTFADMLDEYARIALN